LRNSMSSLRSFMSCGFIRSAKCCLKSTTYTMNASSIKAVLSGDLRKKLVDFASLE
jgi:hypothetical protein